jgi:hypothetical protein
MGATGLEPVTPSVSSKGIIDASGNQQGLTADTSDRCTIRCTSEPQPANAGTVEALAAALLTLSPADRARLAALLVAGQQGQPEGKTL